MWKGRERDKEWYTIWEENGSENGAGFYKIPYLAATRLIAEEKGFHMWMYGFGRSILPTLITMESERP